MKRSRLLGVALGATVAALVIRALLVLLVDDGTKGAVAAYVLTPSRMDALAFGAVVAICLRDERLRSSIKKLAPAAALISAAMILAIGMIRSGFSLIDPWIETIGFSANAILGAAIITLSVTRARSGRLNRLLSMRVLTTLGAYSYCLYVIHTAFYFAVIRVYGQFGPYITFGSEIPAAIVVFIVSTAVLAGLGWISWHGFEKRFLALKKHFPNETASASGRVTAPAGTRAEQTLDLNR